MKRLLLVLFIVEMVITSCQTKTNVLPADLTAAKAAVTKALDSHWSAVKAKDADAVMALLTDDVLSCGTDSKEFWNKTDMYNTIKQMFADTSLKIDITIDKCDSTGIYGYNIPRDILKFSLVRDGGEGRIRCTS
jgi:hypothetical protein